MDTLQIYVACLASYNNGILHGRWISADLSVSEVHAEINEMLSDSLVMVAEDWAIHDYEGFGKINLSEYEDLETVVKYAEFIKEHGELGQELIADFGFDKAQKMIEDEYHGAYDSEVDFAEHIIDECYSNLLPENLACYFNYQAFACDLFISEYCSVYVDGSVHVFACY